MSYLETKTLKWINQERMKRGAMLLTELPQGNEKNPSGCVIANGLIDLGLPSIQGTRLVCPPGYNQLDETRLRVPWYARVLANRFDKGKYDHLIGQKDANQIEKIVPTVTPSCWDKLRMARAIREAEQEIAREQSEALAKAWREAREHREERKRMREVAYEAWAMYVGDMGDIAAEDEIRGILLTVKHAPREHAEIAAN